MSNIPIVGWMKDGVVTEFTDLPFVAKHWRNEGARVEEIVLRRDVPDFDLKTHLRRQRTWSADTFGPGARAKGVVDHIRKELNEIEGDPQDITEWIDVVILALDGAWRSGATEDQIIAALAAKQAINEQRDWPDWRTADPNKAIEHTRSADGSPTAE